VQFAPETWWLADSINMNAQSPSPYFIDAIEDSDLLLIDGPSHQSIVEQVPSYARAIRAGLQKHASAKDQPIVSALSASAEERYLESLKSIPLPVLHYLVVHRAVVVIGASLAAYTISPSKIVMTHFRSLICALLTL
jgi:hypothetical protein